MEDVKIKAFLAIENGSGAGYGYGDGDGSGSGSGYGYGAGSGSGYGYGAGSGSGYGYGAGSGYGYGSGAGYGDGSGAGYGDGDGSGSGSGYGYGYGSGAGYGDGDGVNELNGKHIYQIDRVQTILTAVVGNVAKGFILQSDLSLTPCYVVKEDNLFAHGDSVRSAMAALTEKKFEDMPEEERIAEFIKAHPDLGKAYPNQDLFDWHHRLTGSCEAGRNAFIRDRGLTLDGSTTVTAFIEMTKSAYNGEIIRRLSNAYAGK